MADDAPKWRRRKTARPGEILEAALGVFAETGFAAAKLTEIARRAGVSKAALYLYFETKEDLFRAVARGLVTPNLTAMAEALEASETPFAQLAPALLSGAAGLLADGRAFSIGRMVIAESRNFPDLARIWREDVVEQVLGLIGGLIARAQARGEVIAGGSVASSLSVESSDMVVRSITLLRFLEVSTGGRNSGNAVPQPQ